MKKILLSLTILGITALAACAPLKVDQMPSRTPRDFLLDIKAVADSDDLTNVGAVARRLRIDLVAGPEKPVYGNDGQTLLGYGIDVKQRGIAKEYRPENFWYRIFRPTDRNFGKALISMSVNKNVICVTRSDLVEIFGEGRRYINPHISSLDYSYENARNGRIVNFRFEQAGCLFNFGFSDNSEK